MSRPDQNAGVRHRLPDRLFHWVMAGSILSLGATAFLPKLGIRFDWVPIHWWSGAVLTLAVLFHLWRVLGVHGLREMLPGGDDLREVLRDIANRGHAGLRPAKYDAFQKAYHSATLVTVLALVGTGLPMLAKIDTMFWRRDPSILSDQTWGLVYVIHGAAAMVLLFLVIVHFYFALIPSHRAYLVAMIAGRGPLKARGE